MKKILILGSTGSIGLNTLDVIRKFPERFKIVGLTTNTNTNKLIKQINEFSPSAVVISDGNKIGDIKTKFGNKCGVYSGKNGLVQISKELDYDILVSSLVGFAGLNPTIEGIKRGKRIALANKETLVVAGERIVSLIKDHNAELIPIDSEHSAIFQSLTGETTKNIKNIILTASGGPFFSKSIEDFNTITVKEALAHPNWDMGNKITIDSATMMNKGLEVIEAHWLFGLPNERIKVVIHPQSVIHSMVEFIDGSIKAQLSLPDMRLPIQYALTYPERLSANFVNTNFPKLSSLTFFEPDLDKFKCLKLAYDVMELGGTAPCILNAANEIAVEKFLNEEISFTKIPELIEYALEKIEIINTTDLETIFDCDRRTRELLMT
jgi:1-deoxy-D-xylulose-5-phosphate reductoisomerase